LAVGRADKKGKREAVREAQENTRQEQPLAVAKKGRASTMRVEAGFYRRKSALPVCA